MKPAVIFMHLPKTGGTTLTRILEREYPAQHRFPLGAIVQKKIEEFKKLSPARRDKIHLLYGHMAYGLHEYFPQGARYITVLRDPVERVISFYYFVRDQSQHYLHDFSNQDATDLKSFLESQATIVVDNFQVRLLSGAWEHVPYGAITRDHLEVAKRNLREEVAVVGLTERFDETLLLLKDAFGWRQPWHKPQNVTRGRPKQSDLLPEIREAIVEYNRFDVELYDYAKSLFAEQVARKGVLFGLRVRLFRLLNGPLRTPRERVTAWWRGAVAYVRRLRPRMRIGDSGAEKQHVGNGDRHFAAMQNVQTNNEMLGAAPQADEPSADGKTRRRIGNARKRGALGARPRMRARTTDVKRVYQLLAAFRTGDAISNYALCLKGLLSGWGYRSEIYALHVERPQDGLCRRVTEFPSHDAALTIYHYGIGCDEVSERFLLAPGRRMLIYHNITPHHFFAPYCQSTFELTKRGREVLSGFREVADTVVSVSKFNAQELVELGYRDVAVVPPLVDFQAFDGTAPDRPVLERLNDGWTNFLFVGRIAPNKRQEDLIRTFAWYHRFIDRRCRLLLVGEHRGAAGYLADLQAVSRSLRVEDHVVFAGRVPLSELVAYYRSAHVFMCMSEHEGFCIPLLEAMHSDLPILAYACPGVVSTLGNAGVLVKVKDVPVVAEAAYQLVSDPTLRERIVEQQRHRFDDFHCDVGAGRLKRYIEELTA